MSTLSLRKIKHDSSSVDNIVTNTDGGVGIGGIDPSTLPSFVHHAIKVQNGGGLGIQSDSATDNRWIFFGNGTTSGDVQRAGIVNQGSDQSLALTTAGTQRLIVDSSGRVTMPYQPSFFVFLNNAQSVSSGGQKINFDTVRHNIASGWNGSTYRFTAPVSGRYLFNTTVSFNSLSSPAELQLYKNGGSFSGKYDTTTGSTGQSLSVIWDLAANDYVEAYTYAGVSRTHTGRGDAWTFFSGQLIG